MVLCEVISELEREEIDANAGKIRWAMQMGYISTPRLDMSHRYDFTKKNITEIIRYFGTK